MLPMPTPKKLNNSEYFYDLLNICGNNFQDIDFISSMFMLNMINDSSYGFSQSGPSFSSYSLDDTMKNIKVLLDNFNQSEHMRYNNIKIDEDFIHYAHMKDSLK
jgi:hypothetical protein